MSGASRREYDQMDFLKAALSRGVRLFGRELLSTEAYERLKTRHAQFVRSQ
jgi:hypothetical protein